MFVLFLFVVVVHVHGLSNTNNKKMIPPSTTASLSLSSSIVSSPAAAATAASFSRRDALNLFVSSGLMVIGGSSSSSIANAETMDVDAFLRSGGVSMPMGVSSQAGKLRPQTGVFLRDGSQLARNPKNGGVVAEIVVKKPGKNEEGNTLIPVLASFQSPWPLATGTVYDVECRDSTTADGAFLAVSQPLPPALQNKPVTELGTQFFIDQLFSSSGRFSFYGQPTDIKMKKVTPTATTTTTTVDTTKYQLFDIGFSTLSQSTNTEVPRKGKVIATLPEGSNQVVMLVGSASALRWKKGSDKTIAATIESFQAVPVPSSMIKGKVRAQRKSSDLDFE